MRLRPASVVLFLALQVVACADEPFEIHLKEPEYAYGVVKTEKGGVITAPGLRIQARNISYTTKTKEGTSTQMLIAEGDLMMSYRDRVFVGERLSYDLSTRSGFMIGGRAGTNSWFLGGEQINLHSDKSFSIDQAFITTATSLLRPWEIRAEEATIKEGYLLYASDVTFRVMDYPLLYLPKYTSNLKRRKDPLIRYRLLWDKGIGPRLSMRYRIISTDTFSAFARTDLRIKAGPSLPTEIGGGAALEAEYTSTDTRTYFATRNYGARDKVFPNEMGLTRYRFQGLLKTKSEDEKTRFHVQWDKLSDTRMVSDFRSTDFEINTKKATYAELVSYTDNLFSELTARPRINRFDSLAQELPHEAAGIRPIRLGPTGIVMENFASASFYDYTYADQLEEILKERKSGRLETINSLYRPISLGAFTMTPRAGVVGIFYSRSPQHTSRGQFTLSYGGDANLRLWKKYETLTHALTPYCVFDGYTRPRAAVNHYYVFNINDGYDTLSQFRFGLKQSIYTAANPLLLPLLYFDLYSYAFWGANSFTQRIPKILADVHLNKPSYSIKGSGAWNLQESLLDFGNVEFLWTVSSRFAFGLEYRFRDEFWWRKADHGNYIVDVARPLNELLISPLSDRRQTFLAKAHLRFTPRWTIQFNGFHGWDRRDEPSYTGAKAEFVSTLVGGWQMKLSYEYTPNDPYRFEYAFNLVK